MGLLVLPTGLRSLERLSVGLSHLQVQLYPKSKELPNNELLTGFRGFLVRILLGWQYQLVNLIRKYEFHASVLRKQPKRLIKTLLHLGNFV